jgi:hypothetical protein
MQRKASKLLLAAMLCATLGAIEAQAVQETCGNGVCGRAHYNPNNKSVHIYLRSEMTGKTFFNFRTLPDGQQIEVGGHYSFNAKKGQSGTYMAQVCRRGGPLQSSFCSQWAYFIWDTAN